MAISERGVKLNAFMDGNVPSLALQKKPDWLRARLGGDGLSADVRQSLRKGQLHTVCESAQCPNRGECWTRGTATYMILGDICTRSCGFCAVTTGRPGEVDLDEPRRVAAAIHEMRLKHVVITSVARDDLADGGAAVWAATIRRVREANPGIRLEILIPDFKGRWQDLLTVLVEKPDIVGHNLESVPSIQRQVRPQARHERSLELLRRAKSAGFVTKSGLMLGLGEQDEEVEAVIKDLAERHVDILTLGQYLQPSVKHMPVRRWVTPGEFDQWKMYARALGFRHVESGPLVRSSYHADEQPVLSDPSGVCKT